MRNFLRHSVGRAIGRFHRDDEGLVVVLFVLIGLIFALLMALNWNTGRVVTAKLRAQAAADQSALAAATWPSRAVNLITGANMMILRNASAQVSALAIEQVIREVPERWQAAIDACGDPDGPCAQELMGRIMFNAENELGPYIVFVDRHGGAARAALDAQTFTRRIEELHEFQRRFVESIPEVVEEQRELIAEFHGVELVLAVPGRTDGQIVPPVRQGDVQSFEHMLRLRRQLSDHWLDDDAGFEAFSEIGAAREIWDRAVEEAIIAVSNAYGAFHYVLVTQSGIDERSPGIAGREAFSVFATALSPEVREDNFLFTGFFDETISPEDGATAAAQAETFNGYDERFVSRNAVAPWPFRVWTTWGWNWQPRLTRVTFVLQTLENDPASAAMWLGAGVTEGSYDAATFGIQH